jgi:ribose transport system substrate-binding protein
MKNAARVLAILFGLAFLGATLLNADLIGRSRKALTSGVLREAAAIRSSHYELMVILPDSEDSFYTGLLKGVSDAAVQADAAIVVFRYPPSAPADLDRYFEMALRSRVDGLIMYASRDEPVASRMDRAAREGVILVPVGTDPPVGGVSRFIGSGSLLQGFEGGKRICARLGAEARIGVILPAEGEGRPEDEPLYRGVSAAINAYHGAAIVSAVRASPGLLSGEESVAAMLRANPSINALFCSSSRDTMGAAQVIIDMDKVGKILIIGADETPEIQRYIYKGVIAASIVRDSRRIGEEAVRVFSMIKAGKAGGIIEEAGFNVRTATGSLE